MRANAAKLLCQLGELVVLFTINKDELDKRVGLIENGSQHLRDLLPAAVHRYKYRDDAVSARSTMRDETVPAGPSEPCFQENQQRRKRGKPANEEKDELKQGTHTSLLIYL